MKIILSLSEITTVIASLKSKRRYKSNRITLIVFRLSACCGLRASEIADLKLSDIDVESARPHLIVQNGKGGKRRRVPLNWDAGTLADLCLWIAERTTDGAQPDDYLIVTNRGTRVDRHNLRRRFVRACKLLNREVTIHTGRHTFCSQSLAGGRSLTEVRDAAGHHSIAVTNTYLHAIADDGSIGNLFEVA